jgi:two-component system, sensor histidine kinase and response regulator
MRQTDRTAGEQAGVPGVFDPEAALRRLGDDLDLFRELVGLFLNDSPGLLAEVRQGLASGDAKRAARAAHNLKGMASMFDAGRAVAAASEVEGLIRDRQLDEAALAVDRLERELQDLVQAMAPHRPRQAPPATGGTGE